MKRAGAEPIRYESTRVPGKGTYIEAFQGNTNVGYLRHKPTGRGKAELDALYVNPSHRNQGIGSALMAQAIEANAGKELQLNAHPYKDKSVSASALKSIYAKHGFEEIGDDRMAKKASLIALGLYGAYRHRKDEEEKKKKKRGRTKKAGRARRALKAAKTIGRLSDLDKATPAIGTMGVDRLYKRHESKKSRSRKSAKAKLAAAPTAVIITGNPKYIANNPDATAFYTDLKNHLQNKGYQVSFDAGKPHTAPKEADLWVGHSRGVDRLRFAPQGTATIALGAPHPDAINHPNDDPRVGKQPGLAHFTLSDDMKDRMEDLMPFRSKRQQRAAFAGLIPGFDKAKAHEWAHETKSLKSLPERAPAEKGKATLRSKKASPLNLAKAASDHEHERKKKPTGNLAAALGGALGLPFGIGPATAAGGALLSGPHHNWGRRALGAGVGQLGGTLVGGLAAAPFLLGRGDPSTARTAAAIGLLLAGGAGGAALGNHLVNEASKREKRSALAFKKASPLDLARQFTPALRATRVGNLAQAAANKGDLGTKLTRSMGQFPAGSPQFNRIAGVRDKVTARASQLQNAGRAEAKAFSSDRAMKSSFSPMGGQMKAASNADAAEAVVKGLRESIASKNPKAEGFGRRAWEVLSGRRAKLLKSVHTGTGNTVEQMADKEHGKRLLEASGREFLSEADKRDVARAGVGLAAIGGGVGVHHAMHKKAAAEIFEDFEEEIAGIFKLAALGDIRTPTKALVREMVNAGEGSAKATGVWNRAKQIVKGERIPQIKAIRDDPLNSVTPLNVEAAMYDLGVNKEDATKSIETGLKGIKSELLRERLKTHGSRAAGAGAVLGGGYAGVRALQGKPAGGSETKLAGVFKWAALGTAAVNPGSVGRLRGMMTTHAMKAPGYAASTQATNPMRNVVSAMNARKPH